MDKNEVEFKGKCSAKQKALWQQAAKQKERSFASWARVILDRAAKKQLGINDRAATDDSDN